MRVWMVLILGVQIGLILTILYRNKERRKENERNRQMFDRHIQELKRKQDDIRGVKND